MAYQLRMTNGRAFAALADPTRLQVFERIAERPRGVGDIAEGLPVSRPAVSQHLKVLKDAGLCTAEQRGRARIYRIDPAGLGTLRAWLDHHWDQSLAAFKALAEEGEEQ